MEVTMADEGLAFLTVYELSRKIEKKEVSPVELTDAVLGRIERLNPELNAFTTVTGELARDAAKAAEKEIMAGRYRGPFHGIPVGIKDLTDTAGIRTTYGSTSWKDYLPAEDAEIVRRLKEAGAILVGKTATHEIGYGVTTNNPFFGPTRNPWKKDCIPGGSSGGSGAAIAADMVIAANGSDGGGSIRIPSCLCGITGVKPTLGLVSRFGLLGPGTSTFGVEGPMGKTVMDCALMLQIMAGIDPRDPFTRPVPIPNYAAEIMGDIKGLKVGICPDLFPTPVDPDVQAGYERVLKVLQDAGATVHEVRLPHTELVPLSLLKIFGGEFALWHRINALSRSIEYSPDVERWMEPALELTIDDYLSAQVDREYVRSDYILAFTQVDILVGPTVPIPAPQIGQGHIVLEGVEHDLLMAIISYTAPSNLTGMPALAVPAGFSQEGLPVGVQIIAPHFEEARALRVAKVLEEALADVHTRKPKL
jgi:aspartyl-tRNA(Asn)/glutamyl-tRNA(Gln) amidotransferase subunit A